MSEAKTTIKEQLLAGKTVVSFTKGSSMQPLLYEGKTYVVISPLKGALTVGDIPVFMRKDGKYVLHRLVGMDGDTCVTRGDNCTGCERTPKSEMLGVVTEICRGSRRIRTTDTGYRLYAALWQCSAPLRIPIYKLRAKAGKLRRKLRARIMRR